MKYLGKFDGTNFKEFNFPDLATFQAAKNAIAISNAAEIKAHPKEPRTATTIMHIPDSMWRINKQWSDISPKPLKG